MYVTEYPELSALSYLNGLRNAKSALRRWSSLRTLHLVTQDTRINYLKNFGAQDRGP